MRQFENVSISQWANPYASGGTNTGKNFYATATTPKPQQPVYRRVVPPTPVFSYTQVVDKKSSNAEQAGMLGMYHA